MAKPTIAKLHSIYGKYMSFRTTSECDFYVTDFSNGILEIKPSSKCTIYQLAEIVAGCFESTSTFANVKEVHFTTFNNKHISVKKSENITPEGIIKKCFESN